MTTATANQEQQQGGEPGKGFGAARDMFTQQAGKARDFAKARPAATAALAGVVGLAILNTLRGRR